MKQIKALVLTIVRCSNGSYTSTNNDPPILNLMESFHCYAQWQCVYKDSVMLNNILMNPLHYVSPAFLFDGNLVMYYAHCNDLNATIQNRTSLEEKLLYEHLYSAIIAGCD